MNYKKGIGILAIFFLLTLTAYAKQKEQASKPITADDIVAKMTFQLGLNEAQGKLVKPIIENYMAEEQQVKLEEKKALRKVLTDSQMYTWNFLQNEAPQEKKRHGK